MLSETPVSGGGEQRVRALPALIPGCERTPKGSQGHREGPHGKAGVPGAALKPEKGGTQGGTSGRWAAGCRVRAYLGCGSAGVPAGSWTAGTSLPRPPTGWGCSGRFHCLQAGESREWGCSAPPGRAPAPLIGARLTPAPAPAAPGTRTGHARRWARAPAGTSGTWLEPRVSMPTLGFPEPQPGRRGTWAP